MIFFSKYLPDETLGDHAGDPGEAPAGHPLPIWPMPINKLRPLRAWILRALRVQLTSGKPSMRLPRQKQTKSLIS